MPDIDSIRSLLPASHSLAQQILPALRVGEVAIDRHAEVDLNQGDGGYFLSARLDVSLPGVAREVAETLAREAHQVCPYSKATRGNIDIVITVV
jgi:lipoyl-dependent peroxiredoxin